MCEDLREVFGVGVRVGVSGVEEQLDRIDCFEGLMLHQGIFGVHASRSR